MGREIFGILLLFNGQECTDTSTCCGDDFCDGDMGAKVCTARMLLPSCFAVACMSELLAVSAFVRAWFTTLCHCSPV